MTKSKFERTNIDTRANEVDIRETLGLSFRWINGDDGSAICTHLPLDILEEVLADRLRAAVDLLDTAVAMVDVCQLVDGQIDEQDHLATHQFGGLSLDTYHREKDSFHDLNTREVIQISPTERLNMNIRNADLNSQEEPETDAFGLEPIFVLPMEALSRSRIVPLLVSAGDVALKALHDPDTGDVLAAIAIPDDYFITASREEVIALASLFEEYLDEESCHPGLLAIVRQSMN